MMELIKLEKEFFNKKILIIGAFHGDEPQGEYFINSYLEKSPISGKNSLYFIPKLNPSGVRKNANEVDLNRNFPTKNWELGEKNSNYFGGEKPASEKETKYLVDLINRNDFGAIITIHAPYKTVNYDGPAQELAEKISNIIGYPVSSDIGYATPGSFGTYCGKERSIPTITIEIDEEEKMELLNEKFHNLFNYLKNDF
ncbi:MAG: murein peptide amidase A [Cyanobacteria bacterium SIG27]|nr:murein peptide amidase A [Cyanobacteria bacterium SIG27]